MTNNPNGVAKVEVKASTVSEAIQKGLIQLGATRDNVKIEVLSEGSRGILGLIGAEEAHVRLRLRRPRVRQAEPEPEVPDVEEVEAPAPPPPPPRGEGEAPPEPLEESVQEPEPAAVETVEKEIDAADDAIEAVRNLVKKVGLSADVEFRQRGQGTSEVPVIIDVTGDDDDLGALIGHQGSTLQAMQYLTRLIVSRKTHEWTNIVIDVGGYRQRREQSLRELAQRMADRVRENGRPISLEPMPPNERRIIHITLRADPDVTTRSVGQDDNRKVTIRPQR
ncbi:MAG: hypothetical protein MAG451_02306 [Anaerolineales bacterium]|nr:hypothetical protein [Anaerolineales bacterium]